MKLKFSISLAALLFAIGSAYAQSSVGIGTESPNQKAVLELIAINGNQGFLAPRLTSPQRADFATSLTAADNGMLVFDSDEGKFYVWYNAAWNPMGVAQLIAGAGMSVNGQTITNTGDTDATNDITVTTASAGDVLGRFDSLVVTRLRKLPLDSVAPAVGHSLVWNGQVWKFQPTSAASQTVVPNANLLATNTQAALEELQVEILSITTGPNSVGSGEIIDGAITNADINANAAIAGSKVSPDFGAQNVVTTGTITATSFSGDGSTLTGIVATPGGNSVGTAEIINGAVAFDDLDPAVVDGVTLASNGTSFEVRDNGITDVKIATAAAIAGSKIDPDFGAQDITTTGSLLLTGAGGGNYNLEISSSATFGGIDVQYTGAGSAIAADNSGANGNAAYFSNSNDVNTDPIVWVDALSTGPALEVIQNELSSTAPVISVDNFGSGPGLSTNSHIVIGNGTQDEAGAIRLNGGVFEGNTDGSPGGWEPFGGGFSLPYADTDPGATTSFEISNGGGGNAGVFSADGTSGSAGSFFNNDVNNVDPSLLIFNGGIGDGIQINKSEAGNAALRINYQPTTGPAIDVNVDNGGPGVLFADFRDFGATVASVTGTGRGNFTGGVTVGNAGEDIEGTLRWTGSVLEINTDGSPGGWVDVQSVAVGSIGTAEIVNGSILDEDIDPAAGIGWAKIDKSGATVSEFTNDAGYVTIEGDPVWTADRAILGSVGTINNGGNLVDWTQLKGVPTDFADGTDDGFTDLTSFNTDELTEGGSNLYHTTPRVASVISATSVDALSDVNTIGASTGQVLKFNGAQWAPAADVGLTTVTTVDILDGNVTLSKLENGSADQVLTTDGLGNPQYEPKSALNVGSATTLSSTLPLAFGGTGATTVGDARNNLGLGTAAVLNAGTAANNLVQLNGTSQLPAVDGSLLTNVSATNFTGSLFGDVTGTQAATVVSQVGGAGASDIATATNTTLAATSANTPSTIVQRDASGNFSAETITANFSGDGSGLTNVVALSATNFTGNLVGDVTGPQGATLIANNAVTTAKIADGQVTGGASVGAKIANSTIVAENMANNSIGLDALDEANIPLNSWAPATSAVSLNANAITDVADPVNAQDAATKAYVDANNVVIEDLSDNIIGGIFAGSSLTSGGSNLLLGRGSGLSLTTQSENVMLGFFAGNLATSGGNAMVGYQAGVSTSVGAFNTYLGYSAGAFNESGANNVAIGASAGPALVSLSGTVAVGRAAFTNGENAVALGHQASATAQNAIAIGYNTSATNANTLILGNGVNVGIGTSAPTVTLDINATDALKLPAGSDGQRPGSPLAGMIRYNSTFSQYEGFDGATWRNLSATGIDGNISQNITFSQGNDRTISINPATTGVGNNLILTAGDGATNSDLGGDIVLNPGLQPGFLTPSNVQVNGRIYFNGPFGAPVAYANGDFQLEQGANRVIQVGNATTGNGNNLTVSAGGGQQFAGATNGGNLTLKAGSPGSGGQFGDIILQGNRIYHGAGDGLFKAEFSDGSANGSVFNMLSLTNNNLGGTGTGVALSFRGSTNGSNRFDLGKISALKTTPSAGGMRFSVLTNTAGPTYLDAMSIDGAGNVGIGTNTPSEVLDVVGNVRADDFVYATPAPKILSVSNKAFTPEGGTAFATDGFANGKYVVNGTAGTLVRLFAGVELPDGATVTQVDAFVIDNDATYDVTASLGRGTHTTTGGIGMTSVGSTGQGAAVQNLSATFVNSPLVDNDLYYYYLTFETRQANSNLSLLSFRIYYTVNTPD